MSASVATPETEQLLIPTTGKFVWKEDANGKGSLEWTSNNPNADRERRRRKGNEGNKRNDRVASSVAKSNPAKNRGRANHPKSPRQAVKQSDNVSIVTLEYIKHVALEMLSEVDQVAETFENGIYRTNQFDDFLLHLLTYFNSFFEKLHQEHKQNISTYILDPDEMPSNSASHLDPNCLTFRLYFCNNTEGTVYFSEPSLSEKQAYADSLVKLKAAEKYLGQAYCVLVLGLGLEEQHHMACGLSRVSSTAQDRSMFETLYGFCTFVVWITFRRKDFNSVKKEVGRMLRSDTFNPAIRVKNAPEEKEKDGEKKEEKSTDGKKEVKVEPKLTPAEYRRLHPKRPAIKSIIHQRSPAIVAILPSPKEEAHWLFKRNTQLSPGSAEGEEEDEQEQALSSLVIDKKNFKIGILGEPLSQFNQLTLSPLGAENEDEENEGEDGEQKQNEETNTEKQPAPERSRTQTAVSEAVTDTFTED